MNRLALLSAVMVFTCSCIGDGSFSVVAEGKNVQDGFAATQLTDGWAVGFERFEVTFASVTVLNAKGGGLSGYAYDGANPPVDLAHPDAAEGVRLTEHMTGGEAAGEVSWQVSPVALPGAQLPAYFIRGNAKKASDTLGFGWRLTRDTRYSDCPIGASPHFGVLITIDAAPLFTDATGSLSFGAFAAADTNGDGEIEESELRAAPPLDGLGTNLWETLDARSKGMGFMSGNQPCLTVQ